MCCSKMAIEIDNDTYLFMVEFKDDQVACGNDREDLKYMTKKLTEE